MRGIKGNCGEKTEIIVILTGVNRQLCGPLEERGGRSVNEIKFSGSSPDILNR